MVEKKSKQTVGQGFVRPGPGNCPKRGGFVAQQDDHYGAYLSCVNCGWAKDLAARNRNPAFSSVLGRVKFMERYGLSVHQGRGLVLARRLLGCLLGCSERIPHRWVAPIDNGVHVAFTVPERKRVKHVWTYWGAVLGQLRPGRWLRNTGRGSG